VAELADATDLKSVADIRKTLKNQGNSKIDTPTLRNSCADRASEDPEFAAVRDAWPDLPADVRKMIGGVVKATVCAKRIATRHRR